MSCTHSSAKSGRNPVEGDRVEDNVNQVGRLYDGASSLICVPVSLACNGPALSAHAGEKRLRKVAIAAGCLAL
jgi:hypothetical protein